MHVEVASPHSNAREYISALAATGQYHFTSSDLQAARALSPNAARNALSRLEKKGVIASPARGFYVIVPLQYRSLGCLPPDQFIPELMRRRGLCYYAGLLSAARHYGASHYGPEEFQLFVGRNRRAGRPMQCGSVCVVFMLRKRIAEVPVRNIDTPRGAIAVSTPEATALDLVGYQHHAGGLNRVATVLTELAGQLDVEKLAVAAATAPVSWSQRLGYLLRIAGRDEKNTALRRYVRKHARRSTPLLLSGPYRDSARDPEWKLYVNAQIIPDLLV